MDHRTFEPDGRAAGEDGAALFGEAERSRPERRRQSDVFASGVADCVDWVEAGVFMCIFNAVSDEPDMGYACVDATIVKVHRHAQGAKGGLKIRPSANPKAE